MTNYRDLLPEKVREVLTEYVQTARWEEDYIISQLDKTDCFIDLFRTYVLPQLGIEDRLEDYLMGLIWDHNVKKENLVEHLECEFGIEEEEEAA